MWYIGSKRALANDIMPFINRALAIFPNGKYIEPFVGGCNMIERVNHHTKIGYDANSFLIALLHESRTNPEKIREVNYVSRQVFNYVKANKALFQKWYVGAMGFFPTYANKWMGTYNQGTRPRFARSARSLLKQDLSNIKLINSDYKSIHIGKGNVIYCDPPYRIFDYYNMPFNHEEFYEWARQASKDNIVFISEYEMPADFTCIWQKLIKPNINHKARMKFEKVFIYTG